MRSTLHRLLPWASVCTLALWIVPPLRADQTSDPKAEALLKEVKAASSSAQSLTADATSTMEVQGQKMQGVGTVRLKKPNLARIDYTTPAPQTFASDGKNLFVLMPGNQYMKFPVDSSGKQLSMTGLLPVVFFFGGDDIGFGKIAEAHPTYKGSETIGQTKYEVVELSGASPLTYKLRLYVAPNKLVTRTTIEASAQGQTFKQTIALQNVKVNAPLTIASFAYKPAKNAKLFSPPAPQDYDAKLVAVGKPAPAFSLPAPDGGTVSLSEVTRGKKAVLVNFWFYG